MVAGWAPMILGPGVVGWIAGSRRSRNAQQICRQSAAAE